MTTGRMDALHQVNGCPCGRVLRTILTIFGFWGYWERCPALYSAVSLSEDDFWWLPYASAR